MNNDVELSIEAEERRYQNRDLRKRKLDEHIEDVNDRYRNKYFLRHSNHDTIILSENLSIPNKIAFLNYSDRIKSWTDEDDDIALKIKCSCEKVKQIKLEKYKTFFDCLECLFTHSAIYHVYIYEFNNGIKCAPNLLRALLSIENLLSVSLMSDDIDNAFCDFLNNFQNNIHFSYFGPKMNELITFLNKHNSTHTWEFGDDMVLHGKPRSNK